MTKKNNKQEVPAVMSKKTVKASKASVKPLPKKYTDVDLANAIIAAKADSQVIVETLERSIEDYARRLNNVESKLAGKYETIDTLMAQAEEHKHQLAEWRNIAESYINDEKTWRSLSLIQRLRVAATNRFPGEADD